MRKHGPMRMIAGAQAGRWKYVTAGALPKPLGYCIDCQGHETAADALAHFLEFVKSATAFYMPASGLSRYPCDVSGCMRETSGYAMIGKMRMNLCDDHRDLEGVLSLIPMPAKEAA